MTESKRPAAGAAALRIEITTAIRRAVLEELAAFGYGRTSLEQVARRAGVAKTAIYRRWPSKLDLVVDVMTDVASRKLPLPDTGRLTSDIELVLRITAHALQHHLASQIIPDLLAEAARNERIADTIREALRANQREIGITLIQRAVSRGELATQISPELAVDLIVGPLYWHLAIARELLTETEITRLAAGAAAALAAASPPNTSGVPRPGKARPAVTVIDRTS